MKYILTEHLLSHLEKWAEPRGIVFTHKLSNDNAIGKREPSYCVGKVLVVRDAIELCFTTKDYENTQQVGFIGRFANLHHVNTPFTFVSLDELDSTLDATLDALRARVKTTNNGLKDAMITGLPPLDDNPILATYLSDRANSPDNQWRVYSEVIREMLTLQGVDESMHPNHNYACNDEIGRQLYDLLYDKLRGYYHLDHTYYSALISYHQPLPSQTVQGCITYYQNDQKRKAGIRTPIKIRKYLDKFFLDAFDAGKLRMTREEVAEQVGELLTPVLDLNVVVHDDKDYGAWSQAYASGHIASCMKTSNPNYGVGEYDTFKCYLTSYHTHGEFSSGLSLAVLYSDNAEPVARSIVYQEDGQDYYVRNYGDDRLVRWLEASGYQKNCRLPQGTRLYTEFLEDYGFICPYVDGDDGDANARHEVNGFHNFWILDREGDFNLQTTSGYRGLTDAMKCEHCGNHPIEHNEISDFDSGGTVDLCEHCWDYHVHHIDNEWQFCVDTRNVPLEEDNHGDLYSEDYLERINQIIHEGHLMDRDDFFHCDFSQEWVLRDDGVYLGDSPEFIQKSWREYIDSGYVSKEAYEYYGLVLDYYSDYMIHENYTQRVSLDDTYMHLADEHYTCVVGKKLGEYVVKPHRELIDYDAELYQTLRQQAEDLEANQTANHQTA